VEGAHVGELVEEHAEVQGGGVPEQADHVGVPPPTADAA
jgi:hypothetical protein